MSFGAGDRALGPRSRTTRTSSRTEDLYSIPIVSGRWFAESCARFASEDPADHAPAALANDPSPEPWPVEVRPSKIARDSAPMPQSRGDDRATGRSSDMDDPSPEPRVSWNFACRTARRRSATSESALIVRYLLLNPTKARTGVLCPVV